MKQFSSEVNYHITVILKCHICLVSFIYSFFHLFKQYLLSLYYSTRFWDIKAKRIKNSQCGIVGLVLKSTIPSETFIMYKVHSPMSLFRFLDKEMSKSIYLLKQKYAKYRCILYMYALRCR